MQIKYWRISSYLFIGLVLLTACAGGSQDSASTEEALQLYNASMATAEDLTIRLTKTTNNLKILDARVSNADTASVHKLAQAYDDIDNVKQLLRQWKRDVPRISVDAENSSDLPASELLAKQKEFQEKIEYVRFRLDDLDGLLNGMLAN